MWGCAHVAVAKGNVDARVRLVGQRDPHQFRDHGVLAGRFGVDGEAVGLTQGLDFRFQVRQVGNGAVILVHGPGGRLRAADGLQVAVEFQLRVQRRQCLGVRVNERQGREFDRHGGLDVDRRQLAALTRQFGIVAQRFPQLGPLHRLGLFQEGIKRAEFLQQLPGRLFAHPRHTGNVVGGVAHKAQEVHHVLGVDAKALLHLGHPEALIFHGVQDGGVFGHELAQVLVAGDQHHVAALFLVTPRQRAQNVVGLIALQPDGGDVERLDQPVDVWNLHLQVVRHGRSVRLVIRIHFVPERRTALVKSHAEILRLFLLDQLLQHVFEAEHRLRRQSRGGRKLLPDGVKRAVYVSGAVHQIDGWALRHRGVPHVRGLILGLHCSACFNSALTTAGLALPCVAFMA